MAERLTQLSVDLVANVASLRADMGKVQKQLDRVGKSARGTSKSLSKIAKSADGFKNLAVAVIGITGPLVAASKAARGFSNAIDRAEQTAKIADTIGITTDALQELRFAADIAGVSNENMDKALQGFTKRLGEARAGTGTLRELLMKQDQALLDNVISAKTTGDAFQILTGAIEGLENQSDRAALSAAAFGRSAGVGLTNLLKLGSSGVQELRDEAKSLGVVLDEDLLRSAEATKDEMTKLNTVIEARLTQAFVRTGPLVTEWLDTWLAGFEKLVEKADEFWNISSGAKTRAAAERVEELTEQLKNEEKQLEKMREANVLEAFLIGGDIAGKIKGTEETIARIRQEIEDLQKRSEDTKPAETGVETETVDVQAQLDARLAATREMWEQIDAVESDEFDKALQREKELWEAREQVQRDAIANMTLLERVQMEADNNRTNSFINNLRVAGQANKEFFKIFKAVSIAQTVASSITATQEAFRQGMTAGGPPLAAAFAAAAAAAGAARVAALNATSVGTSSFSAGSGGGGASAVGSPVSEFTEREREPQSQTTIIIEGNVVDQDKFAREIIPSINKAIADGVS